MKAIMHTFDTHKHIKELQATAFDERQAEVIVKSLFESRDYDVSKLATKEQVFVLEKDVKSIEKDVKSLRVEMREGFQCIYKEMKNFATKDELQMLRTELLTEMKNFVTKDEFYSYVKSETTAVKNDILKWMIPLLLAIMLQLFFK
jgi:capsule polysaccharide export protein KpsE/RkpR